MNNQQLVPPSRQCSTTPVGFCQGFLNNELCDHEYPPHSPNLASIDFLPVPATEMSIEEAEIFVKLLTSIRMLRKS